MNKKPDKENARAAARKLISEHNIKAAPVPIERIAKALGIRIEYAPLDGELSGLACIREGVPIVGVNNLHAPSRQRFTIAHELGHVQLHREELMKAVHVDRGSLRREGALRRDGLASSGVDPSEIEANAFAAELLMPEAFLVQELDGRSVDLEDDDAVASLAKRFRVSEAAMRLRLNSFGDCE